MALDSWLIVYEFKIKLNKFENIMVLDFIYNYRLAKYGPLNSKIVELRLMNK